MSEIQVIPESAIEAAAEALYDAFGWDEGTMEKVARATLEAAAPHMIAEALESAADDTGDSEHGLVSKEVTDRIGHMQRHNVSAVATWLRGRAESHRPDIRKAVGGSRSEAWDEGYGAAATDAFAASQGCAGRLPNPYRAAR